MPLSRFARRPRPLPARVTEFYLSVRHSELEVLPTTTFFFASSALKSRSEKRVYLLVVGPAFFQK